MHSIAIKFLGFLEENIKYFSICMPSSGTDEELNVSQ